jgi:hypothetical protein
MILDEALDLLDCMSFQLVNDESLMLDKSDIISKLDALEEFKSSSQEQIMESNKEELNQEMESLNSVLRSRRDMLQMIICAVDHWNRA